MRLNGRPNAKVRSQITFRNGNLLTVAVDGVVKGTGTGSTIQDARQNAAREALAVSLHLLARVRRSSYSFRHIIRRLGPEIGTVITR